MTFLNGALSYKIDKLVEQQEEAHEHLVQRVRSALEGFNYKAANEVTGFDFVEWFTEVALKSETDYDLELESMICRDASWRLHVAGLANDWMIYLVNECNLDAHKLATELNEEQ